MGWGRDTKQKADLTIKLLAELEVLSSSQVFIDAYVSDEGKLVTLLR